MQLPSLNAPDDDPCPGTFSFGGRSYVSGKLGEVGSSRLVHRRCPCWTRPRGGHTPTGRACSATLDTLGWRIDACIQLVAEVRATWRGNQPFLINGPVGPFGDGYRVEDVMTRDGAADYHGFQISRTADVGVDIITALTMGYVGEAAGIALAARAVGVPAVVSFTLETDGRLPTACPRRSDRGHLRR